MSRVTSCLLDPLFLVAMATLIFLLVLARQGV